MELKWKRSTFNEWVKEYSSKVKDISIEELELNNYQSPYVQMFNILKEAGWSKDGKKWVSPTGNKGFIKIGDAYISQKREERIKEMGR